MAWTCRWPRSPACGASSRTPHGLLGLLAELHSAGAAVDFSLLCPDGRLVDAPLPAWTNRAAAAHRAQKPAVQDANTVAAHPLLGLARAADGGTGAARLAGRRRYRGAAVVGRPPDHQRGRVSRGRLLRDGVGRRRKPYSASASEVRDIRFEEMLLLDDETPVGAVATVEAPGGATFVVETDQRR